MCIYIHAGQSPEERQRQRQIHRERAVGTLLLFFGPHLQLHELVAVVRDLVTRLAQLRGGGLGLPLPLGLLRLRLGQLGLGGRLTTREVRRVSHTRDGGRYYQR
jgi:hypothetical protein